jgi:hypothetical protein
VHVHFDCPKCLKTDDVEVGSTTSTVACRHCGWTKPIDERDFSADAPRRCLICGCDDLWRQKDFPPQLGLAIVAIGIVSSTIAVAYMRPTLAIGILMFFALADMILFSIMRDALVCYRCHARYRGAVIGESHPKFDLELNERYRQEAARMQTLPGKAAPR